MCLLWLWLSLYCNICLKFTYCPRLPFSPLLPPHPPHTPSPPPSVPLSPLLTLPGEGGAGSAADVGGGAQEARGGREEAPGRDGPPAAAGGGGGEDEGEALLAGQWSRGRWRRWGRWRKWGRGDAEERLSCTAGSKGCNGRSSRREEHENRLLLQTILHVTDCNDSVPVCNSQLVQVTRID